MKKFKVIYTVNNTTEVFKVIAADKNHAVEILRKRVHTPIHIIRVIEVKGEPQKSFTQMNVVIACAIAFIILVIIVIASSCGSHNDLEPVSYERYVVKEGDSLWYIGSHSNAWNIIENTYIINDIKEESNCTALIYPGQIVYIPVYDLE